MKIEVIQSKNTESQQQLDESMLFLDKILYVPYGLTMPTLTDETYFFRVVFDEKILSVARLCLDPGEVIYKRSGLEEFVEFSNNVAYFQGVAVDPLFENIGLGSLLYYLRRTRARVEGKTMGLALVRTTFIQFYLNLGYTLLKSESQETVRGPLKRQWVKGQLL